MDLNSIGQKLSSTAGVTMHLESPDGFRLFAYEDPKNGWKITIDPESEEHECFPCLFEMVGQDSSAFRRRKAEMFRLAQSNRKLKFTEAENEGMKTVAAGVSGWSHIVWKDDPKDPDSKPYLIEYSNDAVLTVLAGYQPGRDQADAFIADRNNFFTSA